MSWNRRKNAITAISILSFVSLVYLLIPRTIGQRYRGSYGIETEPEPVDSRWSHRVEHHPVSRFQHLPSGSPTVFPAVQANQVKNESPEAKATRLSRLQTIKASFEHSWNGYRTKAWLADEVTPVSGGRKNTFGGWAATLVDSLDTLWIMGMTKEFDEAVKAVATIDFETSTSDDINVFETTIRYLGGMLSAYDLSGEVVLLQKAEQLGHMLYAAFDTPNRMPMRFLKWKEVRDGASQIAPGGTISADVGSLGLEFTRLAQLTGQMKFYDAVQRITQIFVDQQDSGELKGMWPVFINEADQDFHSGNTFTFGGMSDSIYEYLSKMHVLLGGLQPEYQRMYEKAINTAKQHLFFRPMNPNNQDILISGTAHTENNGARVTLDPEGQHLGCFTGGMVGMGAKLFHRNEDLDVARKLADGCFWAYDSMPSGIMPEIMIAVACPDRSSCPWNELAWKNEVAARTGLPSSEADKIIAEQRLPPGFAAFRDRRYILRPEALESIFYMYRITGDSIWQDKAWKMYTAIEKATKASYGFSAVDDVSAQTLRQSDSMESFWTAETLKYLYLIFSDPSLISLDDYVLNTEAHPLRRTTIAKRWW